MQSTQHYIDNERNFITNIGQNQPAEVIKFKTAILPVVEQVEVDVAIEKEIARLQEAKINQGIKKVVPVDFDTELGSFFYSISQEKEELKEKVKKEAKTISGLEDLFNELSAAKKKKAIHFQDTTSKFSGRRGYRDVVAPENDSSDYDLEKHVMNGG